MTHAADEYSPQVNLTGRLVALGPLDRALVSHYHRWANDPETSRTLGLSWPITLDRSIAIFDERSCASDAVWFTIFEPGSGRPIGLTHLFEIDLRHRRASFGILIGEADARGRGCGTEATRLVLDYAFDHVGLSNVMLTVYADNVAGSRAYERAGFRAFGRRRACSTRGQTSVDLLYMEALPGTVAGVVDVPVQGP